ncbi:calponin homology domain-containing protein DDB_G0272472 isoform X3 [Aethina tumida]|uniref:calponin homology domain-containing protein DDB_G0272472 isoform X3 n=1 Tax=Aethina tumida TaxID=116153 RepID=UPI002149224E|nr:calponin homology domain-containing protein DDB_G0272472 isoform X3 [Aethina tumida]
MFGKRCNNTMSSFYRIWTELCERLRLRRGRGDTSEDDEGLPRSPCNSPTTADSHLHNKTAKDLATKSHSTCSDGSLLSMDSSEMDEDSYGLNSRHSSKLSLHDKRSVEQDSDFEIGSSTTPLNHSAAHHRVAVRPKRTHGAPRRKRGSALPSSALPVTPEVNEDSSLRSVTPENRVSVTELCSLNSKRTVLTENQLKCSSLPPGLVGPGSDPKLNRSKSNAGSKSQDHFSVLSEHKEEKSEKSLFQKLIRSSGKKKRSKEKHQEHLQYTSTSISNAFSSISTASTTITSRVESKPIVAPRSSASTRQRVHPKNIPVTPEEERKDPVLPKPSPEKSLSPIQFELETRIKQRQSVLSTSPKSPPQSPKVPRSPVIIKTDITKRISSRHEEFMSEEISPKIVLRKSIDDETDFCKSLTNFTANDNQKPPKPIIKSHSFKMTKEDDKSDNKIISKAASSDSIIVIEPVVSLKSENPIKSKNTEQTESNYDSLGSDILNDVKEITNEIVSGIKENYSVAKSNSNEDLLSNTKVFKDKTNEIIMLDKQESNIKRNNPPLSDITISGPSHTAVVNISSSKSSNVTESYTSKKIQHENIEKDFTKTISVKESHVSVTKIQQKHESTTVKHETVNTKDIPEFLNKQLNKVESKPTTNVIFSMKTSRVTEDIEKPRSLDDISTTEKNVSPLKQNFIITENTTNAKQMMIDSDANSDSKEKNIAKCKKTESRVTEEFENIKSVKESEIGVKEKNVSVSSLNPITTEKNEISTSVKPVIIDSDVDLDIIERNTSRYKKNDKTPKKAQTPETAKRPYSKSLSISLDSLKNDSNTNSDKSSSQDSLSEKEKTTESVVLRRKSAIKKNDDEPELMKVFARRSLKIRDSDSESLSQSIESSMKESKIKDGDKENHNNSPNEEKKIIKGEVEPERQDKLNVSEVQQKNSVSVKEPLNECTASESIDNIPHDTILESTAEVTLRKSPQKNVLPYPRSVSMTYKPQDVPFKKPSFVERRTTTNFWQRNEDSEFKHKTEEIITSISPKEEIIAEELNTTPKNFNQRKAEWEKRAQLAKKNAVP